MNSSGGRENEDYKENYHVISLPQYVSSCLNHVVVIHENRTLMFFNRVFNKRKNLYVYHTKLV